MKRNQIMNMNLFLIHKLKNKKKLSILIKGCLHFQIKINKNNFNKNQNKKIKFKKKCYNKYVNLNK